jgi:glycosyltransferase involved in cell wall biosynthesis
MKILQVCSYLYPALTYGGPAKVVYDLSVALSKDNNVTIYTTDVWDQHRRIRSNEKAKSKRAFRVLYFKNLVNNWAYSARFFTGFGMVIQFIKEMKQFDITHIHDVYIVPQLLIGYICILAKKPFVFSPHGVLDPIRSVRRSFIKKIVWAVAKPVLNHSRMIIATSDKEARDLKKIGLKRIEVIHNGIPNTSKIKIKPLTLKLSSKKTILYIGKLHPQKGLMELMAAYQQAEKKYQLIIAGPDDGSLNNLLSFKQKNDLTDVHIVGYVDDAQKKSLYKVADVFAYPSYTEGFSISILEALQAGVPALITKGCNFPEVEQHHAGIIIPGKNIKKELVSALTKIYTIKSFRSTYGKRAIQLIKDNFSIEQMATKCLHAYETII